MPVSSNYLSTCKKCKALCCTLVLPPVTRKERDDILDMGFDDHFSSIGNGVYIIKPTKQGNCPYLKTDYTCKINEVKPKLCKIWPVIPRHKNNKRGCIVIKCPIFPQISKDELKQAKKESETIPLPIINHLWDISNETKKKYKQFKYEEI